MARVKERLAAKEVDWTLVATSCVEAGVDFSFRTAFRDSWGLLNLLQIAGCTAPAGIQNRTSQMADWLGRIMDTGKLPVKPLGHGGELWAWIGEYNSFLGYMAGVLPLVKAGKTGFEPL